MKTCPVCHAVAFDDATICFGCMYRYEDVTTFAPKSDEATLLHPADDAPKPTDSDDPRSANNDPAPEALATSEQRTASTTSEQPAASDPPTFYIKMMPTQDPEGVISWACSVVV